MKLRSGLVWAAVLIMAFPVAAQKVKVGYDKSKDFSKYKTYTWAEPTMPTSRPLLYATVVSAIDGELTTKGFTRVSSNGDLTLSGTGGIDFATAVTSGAPAAPILMGPSAPTNNTMWTGTGGGQLMAVVPEGTLVLEFVDRNTNQLVWSGRVSEKLSMEQKQESLALASGAVLKLLKKFPPKK